MDESNGFLLRGLGVRVPSGVPYGALAQWREYAATNRKIGVRLPYALPFDFYKKICYNIYTS